MNLRGKVMINCSEATYLVSKRQDTAISSADKMRLWFHLMMCKYCRRFSVQVKWLARGMQFFKKRVQGREVFALADEKKKALNELIKREMEQ